MTPASTVKSESTRRRILDAAAWSFSREGFAATTTRTVAKLAKVNVATLNYHFGGKEALHAEVLNAAHDDLATFVVPEDLPDDPARRVRVVVAALYHFARSRRGSLRLLLRTTLREGALPEPLLARQTADGMGRARDMLEALNLPEGAQIGHLALLSLNHLVARYAISAERAVAPFVVETDVDEEIARHLGDVAVALLLPG